MSPFPTRRQFLYTSGSLMALPWLGAMADSAVPLSLDDLWAGFAEMDRTTPLAVEVLKEWEESGVVCQLLRYQVGIFKGEPSRVAAFYAYPKGGTKLPAILDMHGGGQSASLNQVIQCARRGYAGMSLNWGGNKLNFGNSKMTYDGPQTDWGKLDATHPPQRNKSNHFAGSLSPDEFTLDTVESPRNSNWYLVLIAARRAVTFLQQRPEVDGTKIGARGHSMGGKLTTNLAGIDPRIKAAVPSCGGSGDITEAAAAIPGATLTKRNAMELACVSDNAYIPRILCPTLWLSPTNDFHAHINHMAWNWRGLPDARLRFSISPHLNHHHTDEHAITEALWFEQHLKGGEFKMPQTPKLSIDLATADGIPQATVAPDELAKVQRVDVYYSIDPHALTRFWRDAQAVRKQDAWQAALPIMQFEQPIFAFANVWYETPKPPASESPEAPKRPPQFAISSRVITISPQQLREAKAKATDQVDRQIDKGDRGWHDWYLLNWGHPPLWRATTRKVKDPKWRGPDGASLSFEIQSHTENQLVITVQTNAWGAFLSGKSAVDYCVAKPLIASPDWQTITVRLEEFQAVDAKISGPLEHWRTATELSLSPQGEVMQNGSKIKVSGKTWQGPREIRNLQWVGGTYAETAATPSALKEEDHQKNFNDAIKKSLEQEKLNAK